VAVFGKPAAIQTLLGFANYREGRSIRPEPTGPACRIVVAFPVVTGEIGVGRPAEKSAEAVESEIDGLAPIERA
jgi:hypothetical protein